jgi:lipoate synthase
VLRRLRSKVWEEARYEQAIKVLDRVREERSHLTGKS